MPTLALAALTLAVALGYGRLLRGSHWFWPAVLATVVSHAVAWACRRARVPTALAAVVTLGATALVVLWTVLGHTTAYGVPTGDTFSALGEDLSAARDAFGVVRAPTDDLPGFVVGMALSIGVTAFLADWAAFRIRSAFESCIPAFSLLLFESVFARGRSAVPATVAFAVCALAFLFVQSVSRQTQPGTWFGGRATGGITAMAGVAGALVAVGALVGPVVAAALPGYGSAGYVRPKTAAGPDARTTLSPLVDIRGRLADQAGVEVFTVDAALPAYWRVTSLDTFNGTIWSSNESYRDARSRLGADPLPAGVETMTLYQSFTLQNLDTIWLPAAYRPVRISGLSKVSYSARSASLITASEVTNFQAYRIESQVATPTPDQLRGAPDLVPADVAARDLALPPISTRVRNLAARLTAAAATSYDKALALQQFFRDNFRYELNVRQGHDEAALENFLFRDRRGYCEQFAGAYTVMARAVGLPTRVAVGFTPGDLRDGTYHVFDANAHAWPEVYLSGFGWVAFEPTPGRGNPLAQSYTGVAPAQAAPPGETPGTVVPETPPAAGPTATTTTAPPATSAGGSPASTGDGATSRGSRLALAAAVLGALVVVGAAATALLRARQRRRWRAGVPSSPPPGDGAARTGGPAAGRRPAPRGRPAPPAQVWAAWEDALDALRTAGVRRRAAETPVEFASRSARPAGLGPDASTALTALAGDTARVLYAPGPVDQRVADRARTAARQVRADATKATPLRSRARSWVDPRGLLADHPAGRAGTGDAARDVTGGRRASRAGA